jgi:hypothetical protein
MASRTTLTAKNLQALGAPRLAELLLEICAGDAGLKRRLRIELAAAASPAEAAREVRKRLATLARSRAFVDWPQRASFIADLELQRQAIATTVGKADPAEGLELMWRFMGLAETLFERCDDSSGRLGEVFRAACDDLGALAEAARPSPGTLADRVFEALCDNGYGQFDELIVRLAPALGAEGLERLKGRLTALAEEPDPSDEERVVVGWSRDGALYAHELERMRRTSIVRDGLEQIADLQGDVEAFIAQYEDVRAVPAIAARIATRLLGAGRAGDALAALEASDGSRGHVPREWTDARLAALDALGRAADAQALRWASFEQHLDAGRLREYLKRLPEFDDIEVEERALALVRASPRLHSALAFLVEWPQLDLAADLVVARAADLDGDRYDILAPAAEALEARHPLAATLLLRAMIDFSLEKGRASRYRHAARHLATCAALSTRIADFGSAGDHEVYRADLEARHGRKSSFWSLVG